MPWPLKDAGGRLVPSERTSLLDATGWGAKYEGAAAEDAAGVAVGVEGFVARREILGAGGAEAVELADGWRNRGGASGAVLVRVCLGGVGLS
jgi:hypothetical protein